VLIATGRLSTHAERLREACRQVADLRAEQDDDHRAAWCRWRELEDLRAQVAFDGAGAVAVVEDLRVSEESRRRRHQALLAEVEEDAAATARALVDACVVVGGTGRPGDDARALAHLATLLPGWGDAELAARGAELAEALTGTFTSENAAALAEDAAAYADDVAFASALLVSLGSQGLGKMLELLGSAHAAPPPALARVLASALGAAAPSGRDGDRVADVLGAVYVHTDDRFGVADVRATGMAAVLAAGRSAPGGGPRPATVAEWARQMLLREHETKHDVGTGAASAGSSAELSDPVGLAVSVLADSADPAASAALLAHKEVWQALLARGWNDGAAALSDVVTSAARSTGATGARAVRLGLAVVGEGLFEGDPSDWTVNRHAVDAVSPALGRAVASQVEVAVEALSRGIDGHLGVRESLLRGLAYVSATPESARAVEQALDRWSDSSGTVGPGASPPLADVALPAAFLAVQEYGHRFSFALDTLEKKNRAENSAVWSQYTWGLLGTVGGELKGPGTAIALGTDYLKILFGTDGTWDDGADRGPRITSDDAVTALLARLPPDRAADADMLVAQVREAFERTAAALGTPDPVTSPEVDLLEPAVNAVAGEVLGRVRDGATKRLKQLVFGGP
jgi:hypothetical protein